ncbi:MAG: hypothetical protein AAFQ74_14095 [Cyanobacteria bacterium J06623_4]
MNASEQALSIALVSKIACISTIIRAEIPAAVVDLSPWLTDCKTQQTFDPMSLDFGVSFSSSQPNLRCSCILLQVVFSEKLKRNAFKLKGIEATGHDYCGQYWRFSSLEGCQFSGMHIPTEDSQQSLRQLFSQIHVLFGYPATLPQ